MRIWTICGWIAVTGALLVCGGCGFKGPLYLPERNPTVVTHPRQAEQPTPVAPAIQGTPSAGPTQTLAGKNKGKSAPPASSPPAPAPQSPAPPPPR